MSGPRLCFPSGGTPRRVRQDPAGVREDEGVDDGATDADAPEPKEPQPKGKQKVARVVLHSVESILQAVCQEFGVTRKWLRSRANHTSDAFRAAVFLLVHDGERAYYSIIVAALNIAVPAEQNPSDAVARVYRSVKAQLGMERERIDRLDAIRKVLYFGTKDTKRTPPRSILALLGRPVSLRPASEE